MKTKGNQLNMKGIELIQLKMKGNQLQMKRIDGQLGRWLAGQWASWPAGWLWGRSQKLIL